LCVWTRTGARLSDHVGRFPRDVRPITNTVLDIAPPQLLPVFVVTELGFRVRVRIRI